jgi:cell wall-associated NlpC family hydrolase
VSAGRRLVGIVGIAAAAVSFAGPGSAGAATVAEMVAADGVVLARADSGAAYADTTTGGWAMRIGSASSLSSGTELRDVALLGGRIYIARMFIPAHGLDGASVTGLVVDDKRIRGRPDELIPLGRDGYGIVLQEAVVPDLGSRGKGVVGMRIVVGPGSLGLQPGTQILIGLGGAASAALSSTQRPTGQAALSVLTLGLDETSLASAGLVSVSDPLAGVPGDGTIGARAVTIALQYLGVPYAWGGASPLTGFDCSGLTMYVYAQLGISLTHFTGSQQYEGTPISRDRLQPGDLLFFDPGPRGPGHEGMYIGGGRFIEAPHTGHFVRISNLDDPSYLLRYIGAVRPY